MDFCHLHVHTEYSLLDGLCDIGKLVRKAKSLDFSSLAITDHGVLSGIIEFYKACKKEDIKPIIGSEFYICNDMNDKSLNMYNHLILLAKNNEGLKNLYKLSSHSYTDGFYYKPRIDKKILKKHSEGIICLTACLNGKIPSMLADGNYEGAKNELEDYIDIFSSENVYVEIQNHGIELQKKIIPDLLKLSKETGVKAVCSNDVHYIEKNDSYYQDVLMCIQMQNKISDPVRPKLETEEFYLKSYDEMLTCVDGNEELLKNTLEVSAKCNVEIEFDEFKFPKFFDNKSYEETVNYFKNMCRKGLMLRYENPSDEIKDRLEYEMDTICDMGFCDYFLIVWDFVRYAKRNSIPVGPGRGSAAGSLVSFVLNITTVDPIKYNLVFERFLNKERVSMPDIDIDFCFERRNEVIEYVNNKYGSDKVAQIITFGTMKAKAAVKDVARVLNIAYNKADAVTKIIGRNNSTIANALENEADLKNMLADSEIEKLIEVSEKLEGHLRHGSVHAAGVLIAGEPANNIVPLCTVNNTVVTQFEKNNLEQLGLLKMDFLGIRYITAIHSAVKRIEEDTGKKISFSENFDDENVYKMLSLGETDGIFQLESEGMRSFLRDLKPSSFEDIIAGLSLYRPGPVMAIPKFIYNKKNPDKIKYKDERLKDILKNTYGCIVYQEQVMEIFRVLGGFSLGKADLIRRAISKKKAELIAESKSEFMDGCLKNGIKKEVCEEIFSEIESFADYAFNKSHATCYSVIAYQTAYLKYYYPSYYYSALISVYSESMEKVAFYIRSAAKYNVSVLPPRINKSGVNFSSTNDKINFGLSAIKGVGVGLATLICNERKNGEFLSFEDFIRRMVTHRINKNAVCSLIKAGCFDNFGKRIEFLKVHEIELSKFQNEKRQNIDGQIDLFNLTFNDSSDNLYNENYRYYSDEEINVSNEELEMEKEVLGLYISGHPLNAFLEKIQTITKHEIYNIKERIFTAGDIPSDLSEEIILVGVVKNVRQKTSKNGKEILFFNIEDISGTVDCVAFSNVFSEYGLYLIKDNIVIIHGKISYDNDKISFIVNKAENFSIKKTYVKLYLKIDKSNEICYNDIIKELEFFNGDTPVYFYYPHKKQTLLAPQKYWISENRFLTEKLKKILGEENVKFVTV